MSLSYDFDIHWMFPKELYSDPKLGAFAEETGIATEARGNYLALFRHGDTARALLGADDEVRAYFEASGFGFNTYDSGAPSGCYPIGDELAHVDVIERLTENLAEFDLSGRDMNGFDFEAFLEHVVTAEPIVDSVPEPPAPARRMPGFHPPFGAMAGAAAALVFCFAIWQGASYLGFDEAISGQFDTGALQPGAGGGE